MRVFVSGINFEKDDRFSSMGISINKKEHFLNLSPFTYMLALVSFRPFSSSIISSSNFNVMYSLILNFFVEPTMI